MPRHIVDVHTLTHVCAGNPQPHVVETWRALVDTVPTGACTNPQEIGTGTTAAMVDCGRVLPPMRQCPGCVVTLTIRHQTSTDLGEEPICGGRAPSGLLRKRCPRCGHPVSALFADTGRHPRCQPRRGSR